MEHIIDIPDTYIGSIEKTDVDTWVYNEKDNKIEYKNIKYIPGLYKIFDEILVNAIDQHVKTENDEQIAHKVSLIRVNINADKNIIRVYNNGKGIEVVEHKEYKIYIPELIFGNLLTSSNYDKNEKKITGGKNGYGAKLANIFSKRFSVETVDAERHLKYVQTFEKNMSIKGKPVITPVSKTTKPYTIIEFEPDLNRFGIDSLDDDTISLMKKRVLDITACTNKNVHVYLNDEEVDCKSLEKYVHYYLNDDVEKVYEVVNDRWEIVVAINEDAKFDQVSFVNGIATTKGGKHVDTVVANIIKKVQAHIATKGVKRKKVELKPAHIKDNLFVFIRSTIENPAFDSQIKEYLTTPATKFGSKCDFSDKFIEKLLKTALVERAMKSSEFNENIGLQKKGGKRMSSLRGIEKLDDANKAGTSESMKCTLILTEGDSAKALAIAGLSVVGRDHFGVFPLKGKVLNVRDIPLKKVSDNTEIANIVKIMGLQYNRKGATKEEIIKELRYGRIMIFTDADVDGSHIKGLLMNLFSIFWPSLLEIKGFIISLATPILKATHKKQVIEFYTMSEFNEWKMSAECVEKHWTIKYYKGLGTSTSQEAIGYFTNFDDKKIEYSMGEDEEERALSIEKIELAFDKKQSEERKNWLKGYDKDVIIEQNQKTILYYDFVDRELIHFSDYDCKRSIPSLCDGLKPSLRKILYSCFKRNLKREIKVAQLAGYISEHSAYHHGEASLYQAIIGMAQNFVGSNNIELLCPAGQFGTRLLGGEDAASPRYIFTHLTELAFHIYNPLDNPLLEYNEDDGMKIEPTWYIPILPMILVNGTDGIGTGFSTNVPPHNPEEIVENLMRLMDDKKPLDMKPWFRGFRGKIDYKGNSDSGGEQYINRGVYRVIDDTTLVIEELPIGRWTNDYKVFLEKMCVGAVEEEGKKGASANTKQLITDMTTLSTDYIPYFKIKMKKEDLQAMESNGNIETLFKLTDSRLTNYGNMHLYNNKGTIQKYYSAEGILKEFYDIRIVFYMKRKAYMLKLMEKELNVFQAKIRFIEEFINEDIVITNRDDEEIEAMLLERNYPKFGKDVDSATPEPEGEGEEEASATATAPNKMAHYSYDYLLNMKIKSLTKKKIEELKSAYDAKLALFNNLQNKSEKDLWKDDLHAFLKVYREKLNEYNDILDKQFLRLQKQALGPVKKATATATSAKKATKVPVKK